MAKFGSPEHRIERAQARLKQAQVDAAKAEAELIALGALEDDGLTEEERAELAQMTPEQHAALIREFEELEAELEQPKPQPAKPVAKPEVPKPAATKPPAIDQPAADNRFTVTKAQLRSASWKAQNKAAYDAAMKDGSLVFID
jgi:hypothetical protein